MPAYYNEFEPYAAQWLRNLIEAGLIAHGDVDTRDIRDVSRNIWAGDWRQCVDGKFRLFGAGVPLLANGLPRDLAGSLAGFGNAIVPQVAAQFIEAWRECAP